MSATENEQYLTAEQLSKLVNVPIKWVRNNSHKIPGFVKIGNHARYRRSSVMAALAGGSLLKN
jgi:hypothetical protein